MNKFMDENFLLRNSVAKTLYNGYARDMPIIDYHCHLDPREIFENQSFENLAQAWLGGDHYKWKAMRTAGFEEKYITGDAPDYEKFLAFAKTVSRAAGNPLYHWTHLELKRYFGVEEILSEKTAPAVWERVNALLAGGGYRRRDFMERSGVETVCTTDDPADTLEYHKKLRGCKDFKVKVYPAFRPDKALGIERPGFAKWVQKLEAASGEKIADYPSFLHALGGRINYFNENGCRVSDHALDYVPDAGATEAEVCAVFAGALRGETPGKKEENQFRYATLRFLAGQYVRLGWAMELHINAMRNANTSQAALLGPDTGFDSIGQNGVAAPLTGLLDSLERENALPKTILYSLNPNDNYILGAIAGCFHGVGIPGKIQMGAAWWYNDSIDGMLAQMKTFANVGLLGTFLGMLTDSRSFLSYPRHEYFRRLLCNMLGEWVENGELPDDFDSLGGMVRDICYNNAKNYFGL